jgi:hypothetical protein
MALGMLKGRHQAGTRGCGALAAIFEVTPGSRGTWKQTTWLINGQTTIVPGVAGSAGGLSASPPSFKPHFPRQEIEGGDCKIFTCRQEIPQEFC